jgi:hypothetical protein
MPSRHRLQPRFYNLHKQHIEIAAAGAKQSLQLRFHYFMNRHRHILPFRTPLLMPLLLLLLVGLLATACTTRQAVDPSLPIVHNEAVDVWSDSLDLRSGVTIRAIGDSLIQIRVEGNVLRTIAINTAVSNAPFEFHSDHAIVDALYRWETAAVASTDKSYLTTIELLLNPLSVGTGIKLIEERIKNDYLLPQETNLYSWPVINDNSQWLLAACELYKVSGNHRWLTTIGKVAKNTIAEDCRTSRNATTYLFYGVPRYLAGSNNPFPSWMSPSDVFQMHTLMVNAAYWGTLKWMDDITAALSLKNEKSRLPDVDIDADSLRHAINTNFWSPTGGCYDALLYGHTLWPSQLDMCDNLAQSIAIITQLATPQMAKSIVSHTPTSPKGLSTLVPHSAGKIAAVETATQTAWLAATAEAQAQDAYEMAFGALLNNVAASLLVKSKPAGELTFNSPISTAIVRGIMGMHFSANGISFRPMVPQGLSGEKRITHLKYRKSTLNIIINGVGNTIEQFTLDGHKSAKPFIASTLEGEHTINITMAAHSVDNSTDGITPDNGQQLPPPPTVAWVTSRQATVANSTSTNISDDDESDADNSNSIQVLINGVLADELTAKTYTAPTATSPYAVQFVNNSSGITGFSAAATMVIPEGSLHTIMLPDIAKSGTKVITDKKLSKAYVESNRFRNRSIKFEFEAPATGNYLIDVHYLSGLGIVNSHRRSALRTLLVDGTRRGTFVFTQLSPSSWVRDMGNGWQELSNYSNPLTVHLTKGCNRMELRVYQPSPIYIDPTDNTVVADYIRIIKL